MPSIATRRAAPRVLPARGDPPRCAPAAPCRGACALREDPDAGPGAQFSIARARASASPSPRSIGIWPMPSRTGARPGPSRSRFGQGVIGAARAATPTITGSRSCRGCRDQQRARSGRRLEALDRQPAPPPPGRSTRHRQPVGAAGPRIGTEVYADRLEAEVARANYGACSSEAGSKSKGLVREFKNGPRAVDGIDLEVGPGEIYGFLGPNGAGKSTTVLMLTTLLPPTAGTARVAGFDIVTRGPAGARRRSAPPCRRRRSTRC